MGEPLWYVDLTFFNTDWLSLLLLTILTATNFSVVQCTPSFTTPAAGDGVTMTTVWVKKLRLPWQRTWMADWIHETLAMYIRAQILYTNLIQLSILTGVHPSDHACICTYLFSHKPSQYRGCSTAAGASLTCTYGWVDIIRIVHLRRTPPDVKWYQCRHSVGLQQPVMCS